MSNSLAPRIRLAALMALFVYPVVTLYLYALMPLTTGWPMWMRTLVLVPLMVLTIVFAVSPAINRFFGSFIAGKASARRAGA